METVVDNHNHMEVVVDNRNPQTEKIINILLTTTQTYGNMYIWKTQKGKGNKP